MYVRSKPSKLLLQGVTVLPGLRLQFLLDLHVVHLIHVHNSTVLVPGLHECTVCVPVFGYYQVAY